ncbi:MAG: 50S ribosomal protein L32 [Candidatus Omnitrophica bacterium]|nr:50S ribosomal protein L32 [Candidatus Omnitrophota bacterium]MCA9429698.1 50S ribosomal protein L32 [Candidatus Omnitrophota bacterium]MCA9437167.1 50S ribosomal protein L32 [Candidatus Omnitrophota bacterium]MCA9447689.1 50S ribosomal protein L32 [Candidatus Omnitrophota bacterium]MCB9766764.1 50S ribosomal protein L32 [Candidatus Omnitrophota bacterium]
MAHPKRRKSKSKTRMGRSHHAISAPSLSDCPNCGEKMLPHRACPSCGFYKDRQVLAVG